jgi:SPP1 family predicted phage head-tail adaptor
VYDPLFIPAGSLRHKIVIKQPNTTPDAFGQTSTSTGTTILTTRASINTLSQRESAQANALTSLVTHSITFRYPGDSIQLQAGMEVDYRSHIFKVQAVDNVLMRNRVMKLLVLSLNQSE